MAFMIPNYKYGTFISVTDEYGESHLIDEDYFEESMYFDCDIEEEKGWFVQLSAPGYLDQTDWSGPFISLDEAKEYVEEFYEVDAITGELLRY